MRIWIENSSRNANDLKGKSLFCKRLGDELKRRNIDVVDGDAKADVSLNVIRIKHRQSRVKILRLDGVWHDTAKDWRRKNKAIAESLRRADGVVYQSEFARNMGDRYLGSARCPSRVIFNASDPRIYERTMPARFSDKGVFVAFSKWRPHKRLRDIICSFLQANIDDGRLLVLGNIERSGLSDREAREFFSRDNIDYLGMLPQSILMPVLKGCTGSIHLCWFDACPNSVVEAICAGVPVITNNVGGTWEIVGPSGGYVCNIDEPYDFEPVDLYKPPEIDRTVVAEAMRKCAAERPKVNCGHVDIRNVADHYLDFIRDIL